mmetsp:Transcript_15509/g.31376  ORF Transcript_15509/g.31376 Transcript_15509/m.31376 type:complete len:339 (-) Transcript_15509:132-1148(-)
MTPRDERAVLEVTASSPTASGQQQQQGDTNTSNNDDDISRVYLIRHGDRFDYANPSWLVSARKNGVLVTDPPLSDLGHRQARETADYLSLITKKRMDAVPSSTSGDAVDSSPSPEGREGDQWQQNQHNNHGVSKILASPYLRVIQTACPTSAALNLPISIELGLSEAHATPGSVLPSPRDRFAYFPQIDTSYESLLHVEPTPGYKCRKTGQPCEAFAGRYTQRMGEFARRVEETYRGRTIVCFSHAASVALVAAFLKCTMRELKFAPCGVYELRRRGDGPWEMVTDGESNPHVTENAATTYPWGFGEKHFEEKKDGDTVPGDYFGSSEGIGLDYFVDE